MTSTLTKRFTLAEYHRLTEIGFLSQRDRVELIRGEIFQMAAKGIRHEVCLTRLLRQLAALLTTRATLRCQSPIVFSTLNSEPEPDLSIVQNQADDYLSSHPSPQDVLLIIEISDSSLSYDQQVKLNLYAEAGIQDYWIFNMIDLVLETYQMPYQMRPGEFGYRTKQVILPNEAIALPSFPDLMLNLSNVFPAIEPF
jgi:Uma2 family endonuclease